tara:strand:+ start:2202 stop:2540 length:339 start_codon:yes stop_codon:yes gene_type:complete
MTDNVKDSYEKVAQAASAAANDAGKLAVDSLEKLIELQMGAVRTYADAVLSNAREALEIKDADAARTYFEKQPEVIRGLVQQMANDSGEAIKLSQRYAEESQALLRKSAEQK